MGSHASYRPPVTDDRRIQAPQTLACHAASVSTTSDLALISSLGAQLEDIGNRITEMADRFGATPDSALAAELYGAERGVVGARRSLERARAYLNE